MIEPEQEELASLYRDMSDEQLMDVAMSYDTLTSAAQTAIRAEFATRKLEPPEIPEPQPEADAALVVVGQYRDMPQAQMARSALESAGVACYLRDENTVRNDWLLSNLMGGMRLMVDERDREAAEAILAQPVPETITLDGEVDYQQPACPRCGSLDITYETTSPKVPAASMLILGVPLRWEKNAWRCNQCDAQWQDVPDGAGG